LEIINLNQNGYGKGYIYNKSRIINKFQFLTRTIYQKL
jgi:hypothetical protein